MVQNILFSGSKDGSIVKWDLSKGTKLHTIRKGGDHGHSDGILALAVSDDGKFLASAGGDRSIKIWNPQTCEFVYSFEGHRDTVSGLVFRHGSHQLFSCSFDRSVKVWNVDQLTYVETL
jgi:ribosomal RNA-processing protein 9